MYKIVGIGEWAISDDIEIVLKTFALASCVGVTAYFRPLTILGMVHVALPNSSVDPVHAKKNPGYYADTALPQFFEEICAKAHCKVSDLQVTLYGGANSSNKDDVFSIGKRNIEAVTTYLDFNHVPYNKVATGGRISRTVEVPVDTGQAIVQTLPMVI